MPYITTTTTTMTTFKLLLIMYLEHLFTIYEYSQIKETLRKAMNGQGSFGVFSNVSDTLLYKCRCCTSCSRVEIQNWFSDNYSGYDLTTESKIDFECQIQKLGSAELLELCANTFQDMLKALKPEVASIIESNAVTIASLRAEWYGSTNQFVKGSDKEKYVKSILTPLLLGHDLRQVIPREQWLTTQLSALKARMTA
jgi:hypothetical protein